MRQLLLVHAGISLVIISILALVAGRPAILGFSAGTGLTFVNLLFLVTTWPLILRKKLVALSGGIIVIKFAILAWILFEVVTQNLGPNSPLSVGWFATGLAVVVLSTTATAFISEMRLT